MTQLVIGVTSASSTNPEKLSAHLKLHSCPVCYQQQNELPIDFLIQGYWFIPTLSFKYLHVLFGTFMFSRIFSNPRFFFLQQLFPFQKWFPTKTGSARSFDLEAQPLRLNGKRLTKRKQYK